VGTEENAWGTVYDYGNNVSVGEAEVGLNRRTEGGSLQLWAIMLGALADGGAEVERKTKATERKRRWEKSEGSKRRTQGDSFPVHYSR